MGLRSVTQQYRPTNELAHQAWIEQTSMVVSSAHGVLRTGIGWIFELGIDPEMPFYQKKNLALINRAAFASLLLALPGTFALMLMGFSHPLSLLFSGVLTACLVLGFNGAKRVEWSQLLFAYAPPVIILAYTLVELSSGRLDAPLVYLLSRQGVCFALLIPILMFGYEDRWKIAGVLGSCVLIFLLYDVGSTRLGAITDESITGLSHGLFTVLSVLQYTGLATCVFYMQRYTMKHEQLAQKSNAKLQSMAIRDGMTGLFNHTFMQGLIGDAINRTRRSHNPLALLMVDVDFFKQVNDNFGHNAGDSVLTRLAQILNSNTRSTDYLGRWGGDELILLLTDTNLAGATNLAEKLRQLVDQQTFPMCKHLTISLGASEYRDGDDTKAFIERADAALYQAKRSGRNKVEIQAA